MTNEIVPGKQTVVRRRNAEWSFTLPAGHEIRVDQEGRWVALSLPGRGSLYELAGIEETDAEVVVKLGAEVGSHKVGSGPLIDWPRGGYPLPEIQDEFDRLHARWREAGLPEHEFTGWAQGASYESHLAQIRGRLREAESK